MADELTLTIRVHDPKEKKDATYSACWQTVKVPREDAQSGNLTADTFAINHIIPALKNLKNLKLKLK